MQKHIEINAMPPDQLEAISLAVRTFATAERGKLVWEAWKSSSGFFPAITKWAEALSQHLQEHRLLPDKSILYWDPANPLPGALTEPSAPKEGCTPVGQLALPSQFKRGESGAYPSGDTLAGFFRLWAESVRKATGGALANDKTAPFTPAFWLLAGLASKTGLDYRSGGEACCCCCCEGGPSNACGGEIILFEHDNFQGRHKHIHAAEPNLNHDEDRYFNDRASSIAVLSGNWKIYRDANYLVPYPLVLGPGLYTLTRLAQMLGPVVGGGAMGLLNDHISSVRPTSDPVNYNGFSPDPIEGHCILFEHQNFLGSHKHLFRAESNLNHGNEDWPGNSGFTPHFGLPVFHPLHPMNADFNDKASSIAVLAGAWSLFTEAGFVGLIGGVYTPGLYPAIPHEPGPGNLSSLTVRPTDATPKLAYLTLFEHASFRGAHKHLLRSESNLNRNLPGTDNDFYFNDRVSSVVVQVGFWHFYEHAGLTGLPLGSLGPGCYRWVEDWGIPNDIVSSVRLS